MQSEELRQNGGGLFNGSSPFANLSFIAELARWAKKLESLGVSWAKVKEAITAFSAITEASTGIDKLYALQNFLRKVAEVTGGTDVDDKISSMVDSILANETIRDWVAGLLDTNVPDGVMTLEAVPEPVKLEMNAGFDFSTIMQIVAAIRTLIELYRQIRE